MISDGGRAHVERERENAHDRVAVLDRQILDRARPEMPTGVDEGGLVIGRLTSLEGTAELRTDILVCFTRQEMGELATTQLGIQLPGGPLRCSIDVHEPTLEVVQAHGHNKAVDQPEVDVLQGI